MQTAMHVCLNINMYINIETGMHVWQYKYIHTYMLHTYSYMSADIKVFTCIQHICIYALIHTDIYIHTYYMH